MTGDDVLAAAEAARSLLAPAADADWAAPVPGLEFTVASVVAHLAAALVWYSVDLWSGEEDAAYEVTADPATSASRLLATVRAGAHTLAAGIDVAPADTRGFHPFGSPDPAGFAAMACDEILVHTNDAARGLGLAFEPELRLASAVLARLYPWHQARPVDDPWTLLLWANGRIELEGRPHQERWRWHTPPLSEWDGMLP